MLPYFIGSESNVDYDSPFHGKDWADPGQSHPSTEPDDPGVSGSDARSLGFAACDDFNGPNPEGYGRRQGTIRDGRRDSTAVAYLRPARSRGNLKVLTNSLVTHIVIENGRATGIEWQRDGVPQRLHARREVVICAGAVQSPQVLMLSGIGDEGQLRGLEIEVKYALPGVGANYHDHLAAGILMEMSNSSRTESRCGPRRAGRGTSLNTPCFAAGHWRATFSKPTPLSARSRISIDPTCRLFSSRRGAIPGRFRFRSGTASH